MKLEDVNLRTIIGIFVVVFGISALVFVELDDIVKGFLGGYVAAILQYLFGSSKGSEAKDKTISDMSKNASLDDIGGGGIRNPPPGK